MVYGQPPPPHDGDLAFQLPCHAMVVVEKLCVLVDFWITFNKLNVFSLTEYCTRGQTNLFQAAAMVLSQGVFRNVINRMAIAHIKAYDIIHDIRQKPSRKLDVRIAHCASFMQPYGPFDMSTVKRSNWKSPATNSKEAMLKFSNKSKYSISFPPCVVC
ncbi:hypothetical protein SUGI_0514800 [Cryptomeria japonica]|nr:hypothetical protein SUGI_0514800 [Cryptomeria japonica]